MSSAAKKRPVPPLQNGDRLSRAEFLRRYEAMPPNVKAERIEGKVYMAAAAVSAEFHGRPHIFIATWLGTYFAATPGLDVADNSTISLDLDNDPQPDACLRILASHGGTTKLSPEGYVVGAPDLIVEVAASSLSYDLGEKLDSYRRNGVREYLVHRVYDGELDWFVLHDGQYQRLAPDSEGIYRSEFFPGLWLKADALIAENLAEVLAVLQRGIATPEHAGFVKRLESQRAAIAAQ
jgi:Uma2 family endonuclease